eukprot:GHVS01015498.1.p1 GENE.GHVS01015498.1~~GHVS01015498.1.p1  ORF type:complete len:154 (+),score=17.33 GHVS01015498.1:456-917(+)
MCAGGEMDIDGQIEQGEMSSTETLVCTCAHVHTCSHKCVHVHTCAHAHMCVRAGSAVSAEEKGTQSEDIVRRKTNSTPGKRQPLVVWVWVGVACVRAQPRGQCTSGRAYLTRCTYSVTASATALVVPVRSPSTTCVLRTSAGKETRWGSSVFQ